MADNPEDNPPRTTSSHMSDRSEPNLDEIMLQYAATIGGTVVNVDAWKIFKIHEPTTESAEELHQRFWNVIMPYKMDYNVVKDNMALETLLEYLPLPSTVVLPPTLQSDFPFVKSEDFPQASKAEAKRMDEMNLYRPDVQELKDKAKAIIISYRQRALERLLQGHTSPSRRDESATLPGVIHSPMP